MDRKKFLWYTDLHLSSAFPWAKRTMYHAINRENASGLFITGDISSFFLRYHLEELAKHINCPIYFITGNHCNFILGFQKTKDMLNELCDKYPNLHWMEREGVLELADDVGIIGTQGWYDLSLGDMKYIKWTFDWYMIPELKELSWEQRFEYCRKMSLDSADFIEKQLKIALEKYRTIYMLTHFPVSAECTNDQETMFGKYWLPYNVNHELGERVKNIMSEHKKRILLILQGHTHQQAVAHLARNVLSFTGKASYWGQPKNCNRIYI
jgi:UDP-2,3-diacylglucosamine pyrophosphatase LpxH